jgi:hypothetical protein
MGRYPLLCGHLGRGLWWFRVRGYGLVIKDTRRGAMLFSDRNRLGLLWEVGPYLIRPLSPLR